MPGKEGFDGPRLISITVLFSKVKFQTFFFLRMFDYFPKLFSSQSLLDLEWCGILDYKPKTLNNKFVYSNSITRKYDIFVYICICGYHMTFVKILPNLVNVLYNSDIMQPPLFPYVTLAQYDLNLRIN